MSSDYWREAVESSLDEAGITATTEQIEQIAGDMEVSYENYDMAHGHDVASHNLSSEKDSQIARLTRELHEEKCNSSLVPDLQATRDWLNGELRSARRTIAALRDRED